MGSANNQLATDCDADLIAARGILYAPDFVVNAGGLINVYDELLGYCKMRATASGRCHLRGHHGAFWRWPRAKGSTPTRQR